MKKIFLLSILNILYSCSHLDNTSSSVFEIDKTDETIERLIIDSEYLVVTEFNKTSGAFVKTYGGYYEIEGDSYQVSLEFNSDFEKDSIKSIELTKDNNWRNISKPKSMLQGKWVMSGRYNNGEFRTRDTNIPRKTMKVLIDGFFQWIAFNTETFRFSGSGGGEYEAVDGKYIEKIQYFSRDDSRVGAELDFNYEVKEGNWHHSGLSSKGNPINEVWTLR
ncbi:MAG TPA: membrane or secreted protein [Flavobacteriaceae bacterium]|jgi:hypothetical protein|nr:membrane or secreted protein [Flavobacteriaceae bacterium]|tara:strand:+ start:4256 stop:4915 length:660 start_codon:yes stop_codon:yes gene_type:complete